MEKLDLEIAQLEKLQVESAFDAQALIKVTQELQTAHAKRVELEEEWLSKCV
jgi:hypothetical protein